MALDSIETDNLLPGDDVATDLIASKHWQYVKHAFGADGIANVVTSTATNPLPVALSDTDNAVLDVIAGDTTSIDGKITACNTGAVVVSSGTVTSNAGTNLNTSALLTTTAHDAAFGTAGAADTQVRSVQGIAGGTALPVSGTVTANLSATDNTVLDNIQISVDTVAAAVSTEMQVDIIGSLPAGTAAIGKLAANNGVDIGDVDVTSIAAGTNVIGKIAIDGQATSGGIKSGFKSLDLDETEEEVKATAGQLHWIHCVNLHTAPIYLKVYDDTAAGVIVGTDVPDWTFVVPSQGDANGAGFNIAFPGGQEMTVGITVACTLNAADADATSPGTNVCIFNCGFA